MQKQHQPVVALREVVRLEPDDSLIDRVLPQNVVNIGLHACVEQELDRPQGVVVAIPLTATAPQ